MEKTKSVYEKDGDAGRKGSSCELHLLLLGLLHYLSQHKTGSPEFQQFLISVQNKKVHKAFNDIVLERSFDEREGRYRKCVIVQSKHTKDKKIVNIVGSNTKSEFDLLEYFKGYLDIRNGGRFELDRAIIYTNCGINSSILKKKSTWTKGSSFLFRNTEKVFEVDYDKFISFDHGRGHIVELCNNGKIRWGSDTFEQSDVRDFFAHLILAAEQPCEESLLKSFENELISFSDKFQLLSLPFGSASIIKDILDEYYKSKKTKMFHLNQKIANQILCSCFSLKARAELEGYSGYGFTIADLEESLTTNGSSLKNSIHFSTQATTLYVTTVCEQLERFNVKYLLSSGRNTLKNVVDAFEYRGYSKASTTYTTLVLFFEEEFELGDLKEKIYDVTRTAYKNLIVIGKEEYTCVKDLRDTVDATLISSCIVPTGSALEKVISKCVMVFQGRKTSLKNIIGGIVLHDSTMWPTEDELNAIIKINEIKVGPEVPAKVEKYVKRRLEYLSPAGIELIEEDDVLKRPEKYIVISGMSGAGKSTLLTNLAIRFKDENKQTLVITVNFKDIVPLLKGDVFYNLFQHIFEKQQCEAEKRQLIELVYRHAEKVLFLDALDEVTDANSKTNALRAVCSPTFRRDVKKVIISTQDGSLREIIDAFNGTTEYALCMLVPLVEEEREEMLRLSWQEVSDHERVKVYAKAVVNLLSKTGLDNELLGAPQQLQMVAKVFEDNDGSGEWEGLKQFLSSSAVEPKLGDSFDMLRLYEMFIDVNIEWHMKKHNNADYTRDHLRKCVLAYYTTFSIQLILLSTARRKEAIKLIVDQYSAEMVNMGNEMEKKMGLFKTDLKHRTIAEYFVAKKLDELMWADDNALVMKLTLEDVLAGDHQQHIMRHFVNLFLKRKNPSSANSTLDGIVSVACQRRALYLASIWGNCHTVRFLLRVSPTCAATAAGMKFPILNDEGDEKHWPYSPLMAAAFCGHMDVVRCLVEEGGASVSATDPYGNTALHYAFLRSMYIRLPFYEELLSSDVISAIEEQCEEIELLLYNYFHEKKFYEDEDLPTSRQISNYLLGKNADPNVENVNGFTPFRLAVLGQNMQSAKGMVAYGAQANEKNFLLRSTSASNSRGEHYYEVTEYLKRKISDRGSRRDTKRMKYLTKVGVPSRNVGGDDGGIPFLHLAALEGNLDTCKFLIEKGADLRVKDENERSVVHCAVLCGSVKVLQLLVERGAPVDVPGKNGCTPLHVAVRERKFDIVRCLVEHGADPRTRDESGRTALHYAAAVADGDASLALLLTATGSDVDGKDDRGRTPLHVAARCANVPACDRLLAAGTRPDAVDGRNRTPLHYAADRGCAAAVGQLLDADASLAAAADNFGSTPLHCAAYRGSVAACERLLEAGADPHAVDGAGRTALHRAVEGGGDRVVELLAVRWPALVRAADRFGATPLHLAGRWGRPRAYGRLVGAGAHEGAADDFGKTPADYAPEREPRRPPPA